MADTPTTLLRFADLPTRKRTVIEIAPDAATRAEIAKNLGLLGLRKLRFDGALTPVGNKDWRLTAVLGATVQQACVVTLEPVTTRIDEEVSRTYSAQYTTPEGAEVEMPEDDSVEALPETLDLIEVMIEALALALPPYPRAPGAEAGAQVFTEPGKAAMTDEDARPFAGLASLRDRLENKGDDDG